jgi:hypothetical protein
MTVDPAPHLWLKSAYNQRPPHEIALKHLTYRLYTTIPHSKLQDRLKELV